jgi:hypothetical protein
MDISKEELKILADLTCLAVADVVYADGEALEKEIVPFGNYVMKHHKFPVPEFRNILKYIHENGGYYYFVELDNNTTVDEADVIYQKGRELLNSFDENFIHMFCSGLYGILLETSHADGNKSNEESKEVSGIFMLLIDRQKLSPLKIDSTWRELNK